MATAPLMPKATAVWLVENTSLTFEQIADFCQPAPARGEGHRRRRGGAGHQGPRPGARRPAHPRGDREGASRSGLPPQDGRVEGAGARDEATKKGPRYTPVSRRQDRPNAILWLVRNHPELKDAQIMRLVGTTKTDDPADPRAHALELAATSADGPGDARAGLADRPRLRGAARRQGPPARRAAEPAGQTLMPAEVSTAPEPRRREPFADRRPRPAEEEIDVDSVFAKLKQLKRPEEDEE